MAAVVLVLPLLALAAWCGCCCWAPAEVECCAIMAPPPPLLLPMEEAALSVDAREGASLVADIITYSIV